RMSKILLLDSNTIKSTLFSELLAFYQNKLETNVNSMDVNNTIGYVKDLTGICYSITSAAEFSFFMSTLSQVIENLKKFLFLHFNNNLLVNTFLKFFEEITNNKLSRYSGVRTSKINDKVAMNTGRLFVLFCEVVNNFKNIFVLNHKEVSERDRYLKEIKPI